MKITGHNQASVFDELKSEWNELLQRSTANRLFSAWEWQSIWWQAYQPGQLWIVTCRDDNGRLIGIAPWFIENHPKYGRVVRSIGCVEVTDYLDLIVDRGCVEPVFESFARYLQEHSDNYDIVDLCNLPQDSPGYLLFPDVLRQRGFMVTVTQQEVCPVIDLPNDWEAYLSALDKKNRHELRRKIRRAEGGTEKVDWYIVGPSHNINEELERFLALMAASQYDKANFLSDEQNLSFFKKIAVVAYHNNWLQLNFLRINDKAAAAYLNFIYEDRVLVYNSGLSPEEYGHLSPGIVLLAYNIRHAIETGHKLFDFLRGNEAYKYRMGGKDTSVFMLRAQYSGQ